MRAVLLQNIPDSNLLEKMSEGGEEARERTMAQFLASHKDNMRHNYDPRRRLMRVLLAQVFSPTLAAAAFATANFEGNECAAWNNFESPIYRVHTCCKQLRKYASYVAEK